MMVSTTELLKEIEAAFPPREMPVHDSLVFHQADCLHCEYAREDLEDIRGKDVTRDVLRWFHNDLGCLSAETTRWMLPYYLKFGLTPEALNDGIETEFLIYNLSVSVENNHDTLQRLSLLNRAQITCFMHFVEWCSNQDHWRAYFPDDLEKAHAFLKSVLDGRTAVPANPASNTASRAGKKIAKT